MENTMEMANPANPDTLMQGVFFIPAYNVDTVKSKIDAINRRARKLGMSEVTMTATGETDKRIIRTRKNVYGEETAVFADFIEFLIIGESPIIKGWELLAAIDHRDGFPAILSISGDIPLEQRNRGPICDHCQQNRQRHQTYVLRDLESRDAITVGSTCVKDFVGSWERDPFKVAEMFTSLARLLSSDIGDSDYDGGMERVRETVDVWEAIAVTASILEFEPWMPRSKASFDDVATADLVGRYLFPIPKDREQDPIWFQTVDENLQKEGLRKEAEKAAEWASELQPDNDYLFTIREIAKAGEVGTKRLGHLASILPAFRRSEDRRVSAEKKAAKTADSVYLGTPKKREAFRVTLESKQVFEGDYGARTLHRFITADGGDHPAGCAVTWWKSGGGSDFEAGETYTVMATVKDHREYKGTKQTNVLRVKG